MSIKSNKTMSNVVKSIITNDLSEASTGIKKLITSHVQDLLEFNRGAVKLVGDDVVVNGKRVGGFKNDFDDHKRGVVLTLDDGEEHDFSTVPEMITFIMDTFRVKEFNEGPIRIEGESVLVNGRRVGRIETDLDDVHGRMKLFLSGGRRYEFDTMPELHNFIQGEFNIQEDYKVLPPIDRERYGERKGLEGPFRARNGKVVYYDSKEGKYYDPDSDFYISFEDWEAMDR